MKAEKTVALSYARDNVLYEKPGTLRVPTPHEMLCPDKWKEAMKATVAISHKKTERCQNEASPQYIEAYPLYFELTLSKILETKW